MHPLPPIAGQFAIDRCLRVFDRDFVVRHFGLHHRSYERDFDAPLVPQVPRLPDSGAGKAPQRIEFMIVGASTPCVASSSSAFRPRFPLLSVGVGQGREGHAWPSPCRRQGQAYRFIKSVKSSVQFATIFTMRSGTTITLRMVLPPSSSWMRASSMACRSISSADRPRATVIFERTLPWIETGISMV